MSLQYNSKNIPLAKALRKNATKYERHLWYDFLAKYPVRFQRQKAISDYIVDFYCHEAKLAIELDGQHHYTDDDTSSYDINRMHKLEDMGLTVLRFTNREIENNFNKVCETIDRYITERAQSARME